MKGLLMHRCTIRKRDKSENAFGEPEYTWSDSSSNISCRFSSPKGGMIRLPTGEHIANMPKLFLDSNRDVSENDRIVGTSGFIGTFEIIMVNPGHDGHGKEHHKELELKKVVIV